MKTIGILGGMGAQATMDFERRIHEAARRVIPPQGNSGYPPMIVYYYRWLPMQAGDNTAAALPMEPRPDFIDAARWLGQRADFLVISANAPHLFAEQIEQAAGCKLLSMIDATLDEVRRRGWRKVGLLGYGDPHVPVYSRALEKMGLAYMLIDADTQARLNAAVLRVHEGRETEDSRRVARKAVAALRRQGVDGIIPGCTEIPLLLGDEAESADLLNPLELLARAAIQYALT